MQHAYDLNDCFPISTAAMMARLKKLNTYDETKDDKLSFKNIIKKMKMKKYLNNLWKRFKIIIATPIVAILLIVYIILALPFWIITGKNIFDYDPTKGLSKWVELD